MADRWDDSVDFKEDVADVPVGEPNVPVGESPDADAVEGEDRVRQALLAAIKTVAAALVIVVALGAGAMIVLKTTNLEPDRIYIKEPPTTSTSTSPSATSRSRAWECVDSQGTLRYSDGEVVYGDSRCVSVLDQGGSAPRKSGAESTPTSEEEESEDPTEDTSEVVVPTPPSTVPTVPSVAPEPTAPQSPAPPPVEVPEGD